MAKRGNGEGTIFQNKKTGRWIAQATIQGKRKSLYGKTRREVQEKLRVLLADADRGLLPPAERMSVEQYLTRWLDDAVKPTVRPATYRDYRNSVFKYAIPAFGNLRLTQLQPAHLRQIYSGMSEKGLSSKTIRNVHGCIHRSLEQAVKWNLLPRNVADVADPPRAKRPELVALEPEQVRILLTAAKDTRWEALITLAVASGMRQSELLGLQWRDVDLEAGAVQVRQQLDRDGQLVEPKTAKGRRKIGLPTSTVRVLREHRRQQNEERLQVGAEWEDHNLVFCTHTGRPLGHRNVLREFTIILKRAGLPHVPFHALRHTAATLLFSQGVPAKVVQERLGHSTIQMTMDIYSHLIPGMDEEAARRLDALLG